MNDGEMDPLNAGMNQPGNVKEQTEHLDITGTRYNLNKEESLSGTVKGTEVPLQRHLPLQSKTDMKRFYEDILIDNNEEKFEYWFHPHVCVNINGKEYDGQAFKQRMQWLKAHVKRIEVDIKEFFISKCGSKLTDSHVSTVTLNKSGNEIATGENKVIFVMQHSQLHPRDGRILRFIDASYEVGAGTKHLPALVTAK